MNRIGAIFNYRPLTVTGLIVALHTVAYGLGYLIPATGFEGTVLHSNIESITNPLYAGVFLVSVGIYSGYAWICGREKHIARSSFIMAFFWLFAAMSYFIVGTYELGIGVGLVWSLFSGYLTFAYRNQDEIIMRRASEHLQDVLGGKLED